jgi:hypothetical protein
MTNSQKGNTKLILSLIIAIIAILIGGYFYYHARQQGLCCAEDVSTKNWQTYTNQELGITFQYPQAEKPASYGSEQFPLPIDETGTNIAEKYFKVDAKSARNGVCDYYLPHHEQTAFSPAKVTNNGIEFIRERVMDAAAGSAYTETSYTTLKNNNCITIDFVLRSYNDLMIPTYTNPNAKPYMVYSFDKESAVVNQILSTMRFIR